ncbi:hypothetical protein MUK42_28977 [Musa troglodytarum]|uniref:Uncharacterized protein n=1 Tax=Musa troglodytarum TaxID=320322 RepID=A0A9E7FJV3_9LILI|nr:hypothetical protein MUK42_28977 [Musa troglodytarum]
MGRLMLMPRMLALMAVQRHTATSRSTSPSMRLQQGSLGGCATVALTRPLRTLAQAASLSVSRGHLASPPGLGGTGLGVGVGLEHGLGFGVDGKRRLRVRKTAREAENLEAMVEWLSCRSEAEVLAMDCESWRRRVGQYITRGVHHFHRIVIGTRVLMATGFEETNEGGISLGDMAMWMEMLARRRKDKLKVWCVVNGWAKKLAGLSLPLLSSPGQHSQRNGKIPWQHEVHVTMQNIVGDPLAQVLTLCILKAMAQASKTCVVALMRRVVSADAPSPTLNTACTKVLASHHSISRKIVKQLVHTS